MAKVYSWVISEKPTIYSYIINPYEIDESSPSAHVGIALEGEDLEIVKNWTINCTDEEYEAQFKKMVQLCKENGYNVKFESANSYLGVTESCDNLRGPEGRGIDYISTDYTDSTKTTYTINYTDGTTYSFTVLNGKDGAQGVKGDKGDQGAPGDIGVASVQVTIYTSSEDDTLPAPKGGSYNFLDYTFNDCPQGWYTDCDKLNAPIWMSSRLFTSSQASANNNWTTPVKITGDSGKPGADGITTEFIYCRQDNEPDKPEPSSEEKDINGKYPHESGYVPNGWTGSPTGIEEDYKTEWCSKRNKTTDSNGNPKWSEWSEPFMWAKWGTNGMDGDGVQYIYLLAEEDYTPKEITLPNDWEDEKSDYQNPSGEWIPGEDEEGEDEYKIGDNLYAKKWYDSPLAVSIKYPHLWVSVRKYRYKKANDKKMWEKYSIPSLFAKYGQDGKSATYIRKIYKITKGTKFVPDVPTSENNSAADIGDWSLGFPRDYENGVNVVWATEAEASAADNKFVYHYKRISTTVDNKEKLPKEYEGKENLFFEHNGESVPDTKSHPDDIIDGVKCLGITVGGVFYLWSGGWCPPYLVTGVKGDSADPINYTTYVFAYGYSDSTPYEPEGTSIDNIMDSVDRLGRPIQWEDAPIVEITDNANNTIYRTEGAPEEYTYADGTKEWVVRRWYQCIGHVNSSDKGVKWGAVVPLYAKDGEAGKNGSIPEYRFFVTETEKTPIVIKTEDGKTIRIPITIEDGQPKQWLKIDDPGFNSDIPSGGAMWQMWAYITTEKKTSKPEEPTTNPDGNSEGGGGNASGDNAGGGNNTNEDNETENVEQATTPQSKANAMVDVVNPDANDDKTEIGNIETNPDLGNKDDNTTDDNGSDSEDSEGGEGSDGESNEGGENDGPIVDEETADEEVVETISEWYGPVRISGERGKSGERGPAGLRGVTGIPGANYIQMYCLGTPSKEVKRYDFDSVNDETKFSDGYFGGIYKDEEGTSILPKNLKDWYDSKNIPDSTVIECDNKDEEKHLLSKPEYLGRVYIYIDGKDTDNEIHTYYLITNKYEENDIKTSYITSIPLTGGLTKDEAENFNIYTWCLQGIETWTEGKHKMYVEIEKPTDADDNNTELVTDLPDEKKPFVKYLKIKQNTTYIYYEWIDTDGKDGYVKLAKKPGDTENNLLSVYTEQDIPDTPYRYLCIEQKTEGETPTCKYYEWQEIKGEYGYVKFDGTPDDTENNLLKVYTEQDIPDTPYRYLCIEQNHKGGNPTYKYYEWQEIEGDEVVHTPSITWGPPFRLQGADGLKGKDGTRGQMIYPMGVYSQNEVYITTTEKAPYVFDPSDSMFYVYNMVGEDKAWVGTLPTTNNDPEYYKTVMVHPKDVKGSNTKKLDEVPGKKWEDENVKYVMLNSTGNYYEWDDTTGSYQMASKYKYSIGGSGKPNTWYRDQEGAMPSSNYSNSINENRTPAWVRFESFQALYTSLGIIDNGLIGSAVYNNEFMYSQYGIDKSGNLVSFADVASDNTTSGFLSGYVYDENEKQWKYENGGAYIDKYDVNPYEKEVKVVDGKQVEEYIHTFMPNVCINFLTGQMWLSTGKAFFNYDGTGHLASEAIKWEYADPGKTTINLTIGDSDKTKLSIDKYEALNELFGSVTESGAVLTNFLGIKNDDGQIIAALDGGGTVTEESDHGAYALINYEPSYYTKVNYIPADKLTEYIEYKKNDTAVPLYYKWIDLEDRSIILASGMIYSSDIEDIEAIMKSAQTKIYSDGTFETKKGEFSGKIIANSGRIGGLEINEDGFIYEYTTTNDITGYDRIFKLNRNYGYFLKSKYKKDDKNNTIISLASNTFNENGTSYPPGLYCECGSGYYNSLITINNYSIGQEIVDTYTYNQTSTRLSDGLRIDSGTISGLRPRLKTITSTTTEDNDKNEINVELSNRDHTIIIRSKATINILLPENPMNAQEYYIFTIKRNVYKDNYNCTINIKDPNDNKTIYELNHDYYETSTSLNGSTSDRHFVHIVYSEDIKSENGFGTWVVRYDTN